MGACTPARIFAPILVVAILAAVPTASQRLVETSRGDLKAAILVEEEVHGAETGEHEAASAGPHEAEHSGHELAEEQGGTGDNEAQGGAGHEAPGSAGHGEAAGAAHGAGHGGSHGKGHHLQKSIMGTTTAVMLLGFVAFIMALFYLVNWHDEDIRQYTWVTLSVTVSIFLAVLSFSAISQGVEFFFPESAATNFVIFMVIWVLTQSFLFVFKDVGVPESNAVIGNDATEMKPLSASSSTTETPEEGHEGTPNIPLKAFGTLFAHITGFAAIKCFGHMQLSPRLYFSSSCMASSLIIPTFALVAWILVFASSAVRKKLVADFGDQKEDKQEAQWKEQCKESEDDSVCLCLSSLAVVVVRFAITSTLPTTHGSVMGRSAIEVLKLFVAGIFFLALVIAITYKLNAIHAQRAGKEEEESVKLFDATRFFHCLQAFAGLSMSWCFYFGTQWYLFVFMQHHEGLKGVAGKLLQAVLVSFCTTLAIFVLDCLGDGSDSCKKAFTGLITSLGLLVGISWEGAFAAGVDEIAANWSSEGNQLIVKTLLAFGLVAVVLPAWRLYILPRSDPAMMRFYRGRLPPLSSLWMHWDPAKDYKLSKGEQYRQNHDARAGKKNDDGASGPRGASLRRCSSA